MRGKRVVIALVAIISLAGCAITPQSDPVVEKITNLKLDGLILTNPKPKPYCQPLEFSCSQPQWNMTFDGPVTLKPENVCRDVVTAQTELGITAYSQTGDTIGAAPSDKTIVEKFCVTALSSLLKNYDGTMFYPQVSFFDDGKKDGVQKYTEILREASGLYHVNYTVTRRVDGGNRVTPGFVPKIMTQAELDVANEQNAIVAKTQSFANTLMQMDEAAAIAAIEKEGYTWRVVHRDGKDMIVTSDYSPTRIGLTIIKGKIQDAMVG